MKSFMIAVVAVFLISGCQRPARQRPHAAKTKDSPLSGHAATDRPADSPASPTDNTDAATSIDPASDDPSFEVPLDEPNPDQPVVVAAAIFPPRAKPGEVVTMVVRFRTALGWYFYAMDDRNPEGPMTPTQLELDLPKGLSAQEDWQLPPAENYMGPAGPGKVYGDDVTFRRRIKIDAQHPRGAVTIPCRVNYQSCNDKLCLRPTPQTLQPKLEVVNR